MNKEPNKSNEDITCKEAGNIVKKMIQTVEDEMAAGETFPSKSGKDGKKS